MILKVAGRVVLTLLALALLGAAAFAALAWRSPIDDPPTATFAPDLVRRGATLAAIGNCAGCHTAPDGQPFAGGLAIPTPFGTIHSSNVTPDPDTGIGRWSEAAFIRAMREGVDRDGRHLYPAFPFDHFTRVTDDDNRALYAYLMTRPAVVRTPPPNRLAFPFGFRPLMAGWKLLNLEPGPVAPDPRLPAEVARGEYLAEGLAHCGACHTPRDRLGAERRDAHWAGGSAEGWVAYPIGPDSPAPVPWTREALAFYLRNGWHEHHGVSRGPMAAVTANLATVPEAETRAIAAYVADRMGPPGPERRAAGEAALARAAAGAAAPMPAGPIATSAAPAAAGAVLYAGACAACHDGSRPLPFGGLPFVLSTALAADDPQNVITVTLFGLPAPEGEGGPIMPGFAGALDDGQVEALLDHLRREIAGKPPWPDLRPKIADTRSGRHAVTFYRSDGTSAAPSAVGQEGMPW